MQLHNEPTCMSETHIIRPDKSSDINKIFFVILCVFSVNFVILDF